MRLLRARVAGLLLACTLTAWVGSSRARAQAPEVSGEVLIVLGSHEGSGIDPELARLKALSKPPFDDFPRKILLARHQVRLAAGTPSELDLPNGRRLRLALLERLKDGRYRVSLSINRPGQRDYLPVMTVAAAPGDPFFVAGQKHAGGTLIIGVRVGARS